MCSTVKSYQIMREHAYKPKKDEKNFNKNNK